MFFQLSRGQIFLISSFHEFFDRTRRSSTDDPIDKIRFAHRRYIRAYLKFFLAFFLSPIKEEHFMIESTIITDQLFHPLSLLIF